MEKAELTALVVKAQSGDPGAMEELLRAAHTSVSYQCRKLLRDPRDAEDMTQEVLLAVYTRLGTLKTPEAFWGWLNQTTANRCYNAMKRFRVELQFAEDEEGHSVLDSLEELDEQQVPDKALDNAETTRMIEEIVDGLPDAQRLCTLMYYYDEMSVKDIAENLGVPENTVKSRLNYARKAIRERVLDYEKKGVKLYGLSPLPFILFFLLRATNESADSAKAAAVAKQVMEAGAAAAAGAGGTAAGVAVTGGTSTTASAAVTGGSVAAAGGAAATGSAAAAGGLSAKLIAGILAGVLLVGGGAAAVVIATRNAGEPEPVVSEVLPDEDEDDEAGTVEPEPEETPPAEDELIPADRLALLSDIAYYGDPSQCRMTVNQARTYADLIETSADAPYAALIDVGEGHPVLLLARGTDLGEYIFDYSDPSYQNTLRVFHGKLEVWQYADGEAEMVAAAHHVYWKEGEGFVCHTREEDPAYFSVDAYGVEGGVLSKRPISSALVEIVSNADDGYTIDGQLAAGFENMWDAWTARWGEGERNLICLDEMSLFFDWAMGIFETGWTAIRFGDYVSTGDADEDILDTQEFSPGPDAAAVLRRCAGDQDLVNHSGRPTIRDLFTGQGPEIF